MSKFTKVIILSLFCVLLVDSCVVNERRGNCDNKNIAVKESLRDISVCSSYNELQGWNSEDHARALEVFIKSCRIKDLCIKAKSVATDKAREFFEENFTPYLIKGEGKFTGYYEASLNGSFKRYGKYQYPIYKKSNDLLELSLTRAEIDAGALHGKNLEILWVDDPVELFFTHVQGSGRIQMDTGEIMHIGYDARNAHKYYSIGRYMSDLGFIDKKNITALSIKKFLYENKNKMFELMSKNPSYIFFKITDNEPIGASGATLTPNYSLAIDNKFIDYGAPIWLETSLTYNKKQFNKLMVAQDTGSAIKGAVRGDIFFGYGKEAENLAAYQNSKGRYFVLIPR